MAGLPCTCLQVDEANIPGNPADGPIAAAAINRVLDAVTGTRAVHLCFGNYGGQTIQKGEWRALTDFLNRLHVDHLVLETGASLRRRSGSAEGRRPAASTSASASST